MVFKDYGTLAVSEDWENDVSNGEVTSFPMAVKQEEGVVVVFSWITWPSKEARDAGWQAMMEDPGMNPDENPMPFDGKRIIYGGFDLVLSE